MKTVRLGDVTEVVSGGTPKTSVSDYWGGGIPWATPKDLSEQKEQYISSTARTISQAGLERSGAVLLPKNSVLLSSRAPIGLVAINTVDMATNQGFKSLVPDSSYLNYCYLYHWLKANVDRMISLGVGATFKEISRTIVSNVEIPLPPLDEQRRIAGILDKVSRRSEDNKAVVDRCERLLTGLVGRFQEDPELVPLGDLGLIQGGLQVTSKRADHPISAPYLRVANVFRGSIDTAEIKTMRVTERELDRVSLAAGDILFVEGHGNPHEVGRCAVWESPDEGVVHQNHLIRFRPNQSVALPEYVSAACNALRGRNSLQGAARTTSGLNTISTKDVKSLQIPLVSIEKQRSFSVAAQRIKGIILHLALRRARLEELRSVLQYRAFRGEL